MTANRIYLSPPHLSGQEGAMLQEAIDSNWVSSVGPHLNAFEESFRQYVGSAHALALSSGTAGIHLGLHLLGVKPGDEVITSTLTFIGTVNPIFYVGATPIFIDSEPTSWNMSPDLLEQALAERAKINRLPAAVVVVHLYGQCADMEAITSVCERYGVPILEDAAEALGATYHGRSAGTLSPMGVYSFNGNKIITTSGGGMLVSDNEEYIALARKLSTQAREPVPHYEHTMIGYNYRMSNLLAGVGRAQLAVLEERIAQRTAIFRFYQEHLADLPGLTFMPIADWGRANHWLTVIRIDPTQAQTDRETVRLALEAHNIESRPVWKPMHLQPVLQSHPIYGGAFAEAAFDDGLCLPSGTAMSEEDLSRIVEIIRHCFTKE